jgi:hypothetical protein
MKETNSGMKRNSLCLLEETRYARAPPAATFAPAIPSCPPNSAGKRECACAAVRLLPEHHPMRWRCSGALESEVMIIPVRDLSKRRGSVSGAVPSRKLDRMVHYESLIARGCIYIFEHDPRVHTYEEEPCTIHYRFDGSERRYTPDFAVTWIDRKLTLMECKPVAHMSDPENAPKWTAARLWAVRHRYEFVLVTDASLRAYGALLPNLELLAVHGYQRIPPPAREYLLKTAQSINGPFTPNELVRQTPQLEPIRTRSYIWHLLYVGEFSTDLTRPLHFDGTVLSWKGASNVETKPIEQSRD